MTSPDPVTDALRAHLEEFVLDGPGELVFATRTGATPARSNLGSSWRRAGATVGVPHVRLHDLRHLAQVYAAEAGATLPELMAPAEAGATLPELMAHLGHATPAAMVYLHARTDRVTQLTHALAAAMDTNPDTSR